MIKSVRIRRVRQWLPHSVVLVAHPCILRIVCRWLSSAPLSCVFYATPTTASHRESNLCFSFTFFRLWQAATLANKLLLSWFAQPPTPACLPSVCVCFGECGGVFSLSLMNWLCMRVVIKWALLSHWIETCAGLVLVRECCWLISSGFARLDWFDFREESGSRKWKGWGKERSWNGIADDAGCIYAVRVAYFVVQHLCTVFCLFVRCCLGLHKNHVTLFSRVLGQQQGPKCMKKSTCWIFFIEHWGIPGFGPP